MVVEVKATVHGVKEMGEALRGLTDSLRKRVLRNALAEGGRIVRDEARRRAPVLQPTMRAPYRKPGTVRRAISVRTSKIARRRGDVGVFVNVRPAKGAQRGAKSPNDPFYWRWLEFGARHMAARPFLVPAAQRLADAFAKVREAVHKHIAKAQAGKR